MLGDPEWWVRCRAAEALRALGPDGLEVLQGAAEAGVASARAAAQAVLFGAAA
jgi:hypothetical protein